MSQATGLTQMHGKNTNAILAFVAITYAFSVALSLVVGLTGGHQSPFVGLGYLAMLFPAAAVLFVRIAMHDGLRIDWNRFPLQYVPLAVFLMPAVMHAAMLPTAAAFEGGLPWQDWLTPRADGLYSTPEQRGWGVLTVGGLAARIAFNAAVGLIVVSILAFFEEVGWRAWLLPRLAGRLGVRRALVVSALVSALWHTPYALSGIHHLEGVSATTTALIMPVGHVGAALIIGWLWLRTESIWVVALAHGAMNNWGQYAFKYMQDFVVADGTLVLGAGNLALLLVGSLLARGWTSDSRRAMASSQPAYDV